MRHERDDGLDTVDWLRRQPWFTGRLGTFGPSYVGFTQWAIADVPELTAMATSVTSSQFRDPVYAGGSFALFTTLAWATILAAQNGPWSRTTVEALRGQPRLTQALRHTPLTGADVAATGDTVEFYQRWLDLAQADPAVADAYWRDLGHDQLVGTVPARVLMVGGWYDIFLPWLLEDYARLRRAGARPQLTIGPWTHGDGGLLATTVRESADWLIAHLRDDPSRLRARPVRVLVQNGQWREFDDWPPPATTRSWFLGPGGRLSTRDVPGPAGEPSRFTYDPADPTPSVGGPVLLAAVSKPRDNRALEARPDVLVFTGEPLAADLEIVGPVAATVHIRPSHPYCDIFVRLCDVAPGGESINVCDGLRRLDPGQLTSTVDGIVAVPVDLWPAGHRFRAGHRLRVQVSGGAHPRYARNHGTGEPIGRAVSMRPVEVAVYHDHDHPSAIRLPVQP
jgi:hypothetical protein